MQADTAALIGDMIAAIGVIAALITIYVAVRIALEQKDLDTLLKLSEHLTAWYDGVLSVLDSQNQDKLVKFDRGRKYLGPLAIYIALLGARKKYFIFGMKFKDVVRKAVRFQKTAHDANRWDHLTGNPNIQVKWRAELASEYSQAMLAIAAKAGSDEWEAAIERYRIKHKILENDALNADEE